MVTVSLYIPKVEAGYGNNHSHNYADQNHSHDRSRTDYADRNHTHRNFGSNYADANHDHRLDKSSTKRIIESYKIINNND